MRIFRFAFKCYSSFKNVEMLVISKQYIEYYKWNNDKTQRIALQNIVIF